MGTIVCQSCNTPIAVVEVEKVTTLYANCKECNCNAKDKMK